jgi:hypothetical protein
VLSRLIGRVDASRLGDKLFSENLY